MITVVVRYNPDRINLDRVQVREWLTHTVATQLGARRAFFVSPRMVEILFWPTGQDDLARVPLRIYVSAEYMGDREALLGLKKEIYGMFATVLDDPSEVVITYIESHSV